MKAVLEGCVCDAMSRAPKVVSTATKIQEVASLFNEHAISSAPVVDESGRCIGLITSWAKRILSHIDDGISVGINYRSELRSKICVY